MPRRNTEARRAYQRQYYHLRRDKGIHQKTGIATRFGRRKRNIEYVDNYLLTHPCVDCGETDINVLEFDHTSNNKTRSISALKLDGASIENLQREIDKCEVRCCNCHRRMTLKRLGKLKTQIIMKVA